MGTDYALVVNVLAGDGGDDCAFGGSGITDAHCLQLLADVTIGLVSVATGAGDGQEIQQGLLIYGQHFHVLLLISLWSKYTKGCLGMPQKKAAQ